MADPASHPARVDLENFEVRRTVLLPAPRDRVWAALTTPDQLARWFGQTARIDRLAVGGTGGFGWTAYPGEFPMVIRELEPQRVFAFTWDHELDDLLAYLNEG